MKQLTSFIVKETKHIVRDKRTMLILFGMPIIMMLLFGYAITNDIKNVRTVIVMSNAGYAAQQAADRLSASENFTITKVVATPSEAQKAIKDQKADLAIVFRKDYDSSRLAMQFIVDGSDPNMAQQWTNYARAVITNQDGGIVNTRLLYNPQMKSAYNFVPAIMGTLLMLVCAMMTSISIVREKDDGSIAGFARAPADDYRCQGHTLPGFGLYYPDRYSAHGQLCARRSRTRLAVLDIHYVYNLHFIGVVVGPARLQHCQNPADSLAHVGHVVAHAHRNAFGNDISN